MKKGGAKELKKKNNLHVMQRSSLRKMSDDDDLTSLRADTQFFLACFYLSF